MINYLQPATCACMKSRSLNRVNPLRQQGLTLVELMVAMAISLLITLAAVAALIVSRQGFAALDASSQLRDNGRFAADLLQRLGGQAGYLNADYVMEEARLYGKLIQVTGKAADPEPSIMGVNNAKRDAGTDFDWGKSVTSDSGSSDILAFRFSPAIDFTDSSGTRQTGMIDCSGNPIEDIPDDSTDRSISVLYVAISPTDNEPALFCASGLAGDVAAGQPLIQGVENFQVLYGVDRVTPNAAPTVEAANPDLPSLDARDDAVPDRYLRADQMVVSGNAIATNANWRRVRSIRIGMVLRGPVGSAPDRTSQTFFPFGKAKASSTGTEGGAFASADDPGTIFSPPPDGRLRQVVTFTIHLRNDQKHGL